MAEIFIVDDDVMLQQMLVRQLQLSGHQTNCADTLSKGLEQVLAGTYDIALLDVQLPDGNGLEYIPNFKDASSSPEVIIITGKGDNDGAEKAIVSGAWGYIEKPHVIKELILHIARIQQYRKEKDRTDKVPVVLKRDAIIGNSEIAKDQLSVDDPIRDDLDQVLIAGARAADLVKQILTFSRQGEEELKPLDIRIIIKEVLKLLRSSLPTTIEVKEDIDTSCGMILADPTQLHQVLMNLCTNAKHAIDGQIGTLSVSLMERQVTEAETIEDCPQLEHGTYLDLKISDTGCGMDGLTMAMIFDPFFTTRKTGEGTGLGLSVVHGIIKQHQGGDYRLQRSKSGYHFSCIPAGD